MSISIRKLNKVYPNGNHALKDVCLEIPTGMFGLLGPNGAGKSTLMRILVALMEPTSGEVNICGYDLMRQRKEIRGILGYLPQDFRFFAKYKTYEFLDYAARLSGINRKSLRKNAVDEMLENGLVDEVERLKAMGCTRDLVSMQGLGYKEILDCLSGETSLEEAVYILKRDTRHFAKRQLTWFRRESEVTWIDKGRFDYNEEKILEYMIRELGEKEIYEKQ